MSDELISRKALVSNLKLFLDKSFLGEITAHDCISVGEIAGLIKEEPTAYDVDRVLYNLKEAVIPIIDLKMGVKINGIQQTDDAVLYERAVEIVKSGGVADE